VKPLGAILAGGRNTRYGDLKAFAPVGGLPIIGRVRDAIAQVADPVVLIANDVEAYAQLRLETRPDARAGIGALGGIYTALLWASERKQDAVVVSACDMPFASAALLGKLIEEGANADAAVPESTSRRGVEPLFAFYRITCIPAIERAIARDDTRIIGFYDDVRVVRVPIETVQQFGDPEILFMNVNTRVERETADRLAMSLG